MTDHKAKPKLKSAGRTRRAGGRPRRKMEAFAGRRDFLRRADMSEEGKRRDRWILVAVAVLFVLNVVVYLCHHWNLTGANDAEAQPPVAPKVIVD